MENVQFMMLCREKIKKIKHFPSHLYADIGLFIEIVRYTTAGLGLNYYYYACV